MKSLKLGAFAAQYESEQLTEVLNLGAGDSFVLLNVLPDELAARAFEALRDETRWARMGNRGGVVPRLVSAQGDIDHDNDIEPLYRHPADEQPQLRDFTPTADAVRRAVAARVGHPLNHGLIQWYRSGRDFISEHADKTLDIVPGSMIVNVSVGATRTMILRTKARDAEHRVIQRIDLPHSECGRKRLPLRSSRAAPTDSLFVLGPETNRVFKHEIKLDKRPDDQKRADELRDGGHRISLTLRHIGSFRRRLDNRIFGQGARLKTLAELNAPDAPAPQDDAHEMVNAFSAENHNDDFDYATHYGTGFDALNLKILNTAEQDEAEADAAKIASEAKE